MTEKKPLDREAVETLAKDILLAIKAHYKRRQLSRYTVLEVLNALAAISSIVIQGCNDPEASEFFTRSLNEQLESGSHADQNLN